MIKMRRKFFFKVMNFSFIGLVCVLVLLVLLTFLYKKKISPRPQILSTFLKKPVEVYFDSWGIPHIYGQNLSDLYWTLGYQMAKDRLFQMDLNRRLGNGELSEIFGEDLVEVDKFFRTLRFRKSMEEVLTKHKKNLSPELLQLSEAYLQGVNTFIQEETLPLEFYLLGYRPRPFDLLDIFAFSGYMAYSFADAFKVDLLLSSLQSKLPPDKWEALRLPLAETRGGVGTSLHPHQKHSAAENPEKLQGVGTSLHPTQPTQRNKTQNFKEFLPLLGLIKKVQARFPFFMGSNSWVIGGQKTASGSPLLANDPHIRFSNPSIWYEAHLEIRPENSKAHPPGAPLLSAYQVYGHFLPLIPFPILGHNQNLGWAMTMSVVDDMDFYREKRHPKDPTLVMHKGQWVKIKSYEEVIKVKGGQEIRETVELTPHGPLIKSPSPFKLSSPNRPPKLSEDLALKWTFHHPDNLIFETFYRLTKAQNLDDFTEALRFGTSPGLNFSYADRKGNIAWRVFGLIPIRPAGVRGDIILEGGDGNHEYEGYIPFDQMPHLTNPPQNVIVSANYRPPYAPGPSQQWMAGSNPIEGYWRSSDRFTYLDQALTQKAQWTVKETQKLQTAEQAVNHRELVETLLQNLNPDTLRQNAPPLQQELVTQAQKILTQWSGEAHKDSLAMTLFAYWSEEIVGLVLGSELNPEEVAGLCGHSSFWEFFKALLSSPSFPWWKNQNAEEIVTRAFLRALSTLSEKFGPNPQSWAWGKVHTVEFGHPLGQQWPLQLLFNLGPYPVGGAHAQVNNMDYERCKGHFAVLSGPSTRRIVDFHDPAHSWGILPTGNSGQIFESHFRDQVPLYLENQYRGQLLSREEILKNSERKTLFSPR